ncbi:MAG TPA: hypothetical protein VGA72_11405 [Anaerolineales bacterium]
MKTTEKQASKRLFKKLSALRATLSNEERKLLDELIVTEVAAHKMNTKATDRAISKASTKASEVAAHKMNMKAADRAISKASTKAISKSTFRIAFDPNSEEYKVQD